ncbi:hypothetical protein [Deinococcus hohokamensis]|uniref:Calcium-binding protein n=1 Tax=Deinococcus hohokamensis TaxID=309883 RepID=A0ABV9IDU3_9DEIO
MPNEQPRNDQLPATSPSGQDTPLDSPGPMVEEAADESGASSGGGALTGSAGQSSLHGVADEPAQESGPTTDADGDGELPARLMDTDGDGTADEAVINSPNAG